MKTNTKISRALCAGVVVIACVLGANAARAQDRARIANVVAAAEQVARLELEKGLKGAFVSMRECYERELPHSHILTRPLEQCLAQDMIVSRLIAESTNAMTPEQRKTANAPDPQETMQAMVERTIGVFTRMNVSQDDAKTFLEIVRTHGMQAYGKVRFPDKIK
jgi:hypothetical protein